MGGKKGGDKGGENSKKASGQARKAEAAVAKAAAEQAKKASVEDQEWKSGTKSDAKKEAEAARKAEQARKKAEKEALLAEDEKNTPGRAAPKNSKKADKADKKPSRGLDSALSELQLGGGDTDKKEKELFGSGIEAGLAVFDVVDASKNIKLDQHPERRRAAAFKAFSERRVEEMKHEGLRLNHSQRTQRIRQEFEKSPENPMLQAYVAHNATREEKEEALQAEKEKLEAILAKK